MDEFYNWQNINKQFVQRRRRVVGWIFEASRILDWFDELHLLSSHLTFFLVVVSGVLFLNGVLWFTCGTAES